MTGVVARFPREDAEAYERLNEQIEQLRFGDKNEN